MGPFLVNEEEAAPIIIQKAQDLLRSDMAHVYGTNVVIITKDKDPKSSPSQSFVNSPHSVQRTTEIAPQAVPFATEQQKQEENEEEEKHETDGGSCTSVSDKSAEDSGFTKVSVNSSFSPSCQRVGKKNTKYVSEESHNVPCALSTPSTHLIGCKEPDFITTRSSQSPADIMRSHFGRPQFKRPVTPDLIGACTPPIKRREISANQPSVSFSQAEETFVLTTQLAALVDNVRPDIPGTLDSRTEPGKSEIEYPLENADVDDFVPLSAFDYEMNDTLTLSMLDNVCGSYSIHVSCHWNSVFLQSYAIGR
ncbi:hypothetical protein FGIG_10827 [Fasciola gigantica]|uniref:Uncharacterized protein n=1 Tax=Fasciola gigantica TaxID=46835 RepID=A0A504YD24_FASGI|nr:hypothetical protein FGIG_10827 [Fasciola gigantica]